jgi:hypothetical protein
MSKHPFAFILVVAFAVVTASQTLSADRVKLRSGQVVDGSFVSADAKVVRMLLSGSQIADFKVSDVASLEFTPKKVEPPPAPNPARAPAPVSLPMGTVLNVRLTQAIDVDTSQAGAKFKSVLDDPVMIGGNVVVPRGAAVALQATSVAQAGKFKGADAITLKANSISFGGNSYEIVTTVVEQKGKGEGKKSTRKIGGGAGLGAIVGGIAGGGTGAAIGAVAGAATGAIVSASGTEHLKLDAETRLQFTLSSAVSIRP